ncbi:GNAT family N-acetyltransferase [Actinoallomurus purpureus]|uniref:GNAT family N-acetyltransferase n=1 Tax=Actinoallomurus purpureus TaxID=478114 RepID=UPI0020939DE2|nr:GNAT family N-acetyltransferase [Actinoallomurus purpureus]MCO6009457.1 GNAT family N-acetyltransferase [Actinoallomurus purpureus]
MTEITILPALPDDLPHVLEILNDAAEWLNSQGIVQWPAYFSSDDFRAYSLSRRIEANSVFLIWTTGTAGPVATFTLERHPDPAYWRDDADAWYLHRMAVRRSHAGVGLGRLIIDWAVDRAWRHGTPLLRLECSRHNDQLQAYYRSIGFRQLSTIVIGHRHTGARFEMTTRPMLQVAAVRDLTGDIVPGDGMILMSDEQLHLLVNELEKMRVPHVALHEEARGTRVVFPYGSHRHEVVGINDGAFVWGVHRQYWHPASDPQGAARKLAEGFYGP